MEYQCLTISVAELKVGPKGIVMPLCETCETVDCDNPIEKKQVSLMGVKRSVRMYSKGVESKFVVQCVGYINNVKVY